ncbi:MAG: hypothetical protein JNL12_14025 [Planctomycetes bacterium]|nr:hypothetical protein [Planctomycetota bacterium]
MLVAEAFPAAGEGLLEQRLGAPAIGALQQVKREEVSIGGEQVLVVTWDNVFIYKSTSPERFHIQLNLVSRSAWCGT